MAITEDKLQTNVRSGENGGSVLMHTGVVRSLQRVGKVVAIDSAKPLSFATEILMVSQWKRSDLRVVAFLQEPSKQTIIGVNQRKIDQ